MIFLSDVNLDKVTTFNALKTLFMELEFGKNLPFSIVLMGSFTSFPMTNDSSNLETYKGKSIFFLIFYLFSLLLLDNFEKLGLLVSQFDNISKWVQFVFIPGPNDPTFSSTYPIPPLDKSIFLGFSKHVTNVNLASNPCR